MKRKHYYIHYPRSFYNEYSLHSVEAGSKNEEELKHLGYVRITRKEAETKCREEKYRRKHDSAFAYYAPTEITSYDKIRGPWIME